MKNIRFIFIITIILSLFALKNWSIPVEAGTYHGFNAFSSLDHFLTDELLGTVSSISFYITWDETNFYVGWKGDNFSTSGNRTFIAFDENPGDTIGGSGDTYGGVDFSGTSLPDYCLVLYSNGSAFSSYWDSDHWSSPATDRSSYQKYIATNTTEIQKIRIPKADVGITSIFADFAIWMWISNTAEDLVYSAFPSENPVGSSPTCTYCFCFNTSDSARSPSTYGYSTEDAPILSEFSDSIIIPIVVFSSINLIGLFLIQKWKY